MPAYECVPCKFKTNNEIKYNEYHLKSNNHCIITKTCYLCKKEFKTTQAITRHLNRKTLCIKLNNNSNKKSNKSKVNTTDDNQNMKNDIGNINISIINNNTTNINNHIYYTLLLNANDYTGNNHKYIKNLISNNVLPLTNDTCRKMFSEYLYNSIKDDLDCLKQIKLIKMTNEDFNNLNSSDIIIKRNTRNILQPIVNMFDVLKQKNLYLYPSFDSSNILFCKLWIKPDLLSSIEITEIESQNSDWIQDNETQINSFITNKIKLAINEIFINNDNNELWNLFPKRQRIYYKDNAIPINELKELTIEIIISLIDKQDELNDLLFNYFSKYQIKNRLFTIDYVTISKLIYEQLINFINTVYPIK